MFYLSCMGHHHHHSHDHDHSHGHHHGTENIRLAFWLNLLFAIIELVGGILTNSVAVLSDSLHDLGDSLSLGTAWYFQKKSQQARDTAYTYGYRRFSLLGAFINCMVLIIGSIFIISESIERIMSPTQPHATGMLLLAVLGITINLIALLRLRKGNSVNERVISLHFLEDVLGWVAVLVGSIIMMFFDVPILDPLLSLGIAVFILFNVYKNMRSVFKIVLQGAPEGISEEKIRAQLQTIQEVKDAHDIRIWSMDGNYNIVTLHVVISGALTLSQQEALKTKIKTQLKALAIQHITLELETEGYACEKHD